MEASYNIMEAPSMQLQQEELAPSIFYTTICLLYKTIKKMLPYCINDLRIIFSKIANIKKMRAPNNYVIYIVTEGHIIANEELDILSKHLQINISDESMRDRYNSRAIHTDINTIIKMDVKMPGSLRYTIRTSEYTGILFKNVTTLYCKCKALIKEHKSNILIKDEHAKECGVKNYLPDTKLGTLIYERIKQVLKIEIVPKELHELICNEYYEHGGDINSLIMQIVQQNKRIRSSEVSAFKQYIRAENIYNPGGITSVETLDSAMKTCNIAKSNISSGSLKRARE